MLNRGGFSNPDVLYVELPDGKPLIVKDYAERSAWVRKLIAPLLIGNELRMLKRADALRGAPGPRGRIDAYAFGLEFLPGEALRRTLHAASLPPEFFSELRQLVDALVERGVVHLDLSSPSNVLVTEGSAPAVVDLGGAVPRLWPRFVTRLIHARALAKLRRRFEAGVGPEFEMDRPEWAYPQLECGGVRFRYLEGGALRDPRPFVCLHASSGAASDFDPLVERAHTRDRRVLAPVLPGGWGTRVPPGRHGPEQVARWLGGWLDAMRLRDFELVAVGDAEASAELLAEAYPDRMKRLHTVAVDADPNAIWVEISA